VDELNPMASATYLSRQRDFLASQLRHFVPVATRKRHLTYLAAAQRPDGGFAGREGESDPYYTAFALWSLRILDALTPEIGTRATAFLDANLDRARNLVDFFSLLHGYRLVGADAREANAGAKREAMQVWLDLVGTALQSCRTPDGGFGRVADLKEGSTYATFLAVLAFEEIDRLLPEPERTLAFAQSRQREDGGFVEITPMKRSGTNPTAAAQAVILILERESMPASRARDEATIEFLLNLFSDEGGILANNRIPLADLLSTFTGLWTLHELKALDRVDRPKAQRYVSSLEQPDGGFLAGLWDEAVDVEYTFYGLGSLALLSDAGSSSS
jgi:geranylgeranyl transferase type-2 subunit beta